METTNAAPTDQIDLTTTGVSLPDFALAMRGYDRLQVDEYIGRLDRWMEEATARTSAAEAELENLRQESAELRRAMAEQQRAGSGSGSASPALEGMGARLEQMVSGALSECEAMRQKAREEGDAQVALARQTAVEIVSRARGAVQSLMEEADELSAEGNRRRAQILEQAERERQSVHEEVARPIEQRDRVLNSLRAALDGAAASVSDER